MKPNNYIKSLATLVQAFDHAARLAAPSLISRSNAAYVGRWLSKDEDGYF